MKSTIKILKSIYEGNEITTMQIAKETGLRYQNVRTMGLQLISRGLAKKRKVVNGGKPVKGYTRWNTYWTINPKQEHRVITLIKREIDNDNYEKSKNEVAEDNQQNQFPQG